MMTKKRKRLLLSLACVLVLIAALILCPATIQGHWIDPLYWSDGQYPIFVTFLSGTEISFFGRDPATILGTYSRHGLVYRVDDYVAKCSAKAYATPLFIFHYRPSKTDFFVFTRDFRWWMPHPTLAEVEKMKLDRTLVPNK